jgi:hypothetical protein
MGGRVKRRIRRAIYTPGGEKPWYSLLPDEFENDPFVLVVMVPKGSRSYIKMANGMRIGLLETPRGARGLQVLGGGGGYMDHLEIIERVCKVPMAQREYVGRLSRMPERLTLDNDLMPLVFLRDEFGKPYLNLKHYLFNYSLKEDDDPRVN